jgi:hypothetical protein
MDARDGLCDKEEEEE